MINSAKYMRRRYCIACKKRIWRPNNSPRTEILMIDNGKKKPEHGSGL